MMIMSLEAVGVVMVWRCNCIFLLPKFLNFLTPTSFNNIFSEEGVT